MLTALSVRRAAVALLFIASLPLLAQTPTFTTETYPAASSTNGVQADLNEDGALDFVISGCGAVCVILSNGDGSYRPPVAYGSGGFEPLAVGDLNGDGHADIVFSGLRIAYGNGDGTLRPVVSVSNAAGNSAEKAVVADFNRDGRQDIAIMAVESGLGHRLFVLINNGGSTFTTQGPYATETFWHDPASGLDAGWQVLNLEVGDFDADGRADVAYAVGAKVSESGSQPDHSKIVALFNDGGGALTTVRTVKEADASLQIASADMNQDGKSDLVSVSFGVHVFYGSGTRTFSERISPSDTWNGLNFPVVADFNGDHRLDVAMITPAFPNDSFGFQIATQNADGSFTLNSAYALGAFHNCGSCGQPVHYFFAGDYNRDRKPDLATVGSDESVLRVAINTTDASGFPGCLHPGGRGINVCSPPSGGTAASPVNFSIGAADHIPLRKVEVWVDGQKKKETFFSYAVYSYLDAQIALGAGSHKVSVYAARYDNQVQKKTFSFTVGGTGFCSMPSDPTKLHVCSPVNGSTVSSPVSFQATGGDSVDVIEVWVDGTKRCDADNTLDCSRTLPDGPHHANFYARTNGVVTDKQGVDFSVSSDTIPCSRPSDSTAVNLCSPQDGSTVSSPVRIRAAGGTSVTYMEAWVDGFKRWEVRGNDLDIGLDLAAGQHRVNVYGKVNGSATDKKTALFTVQQ